MLETCKRQGVLLATCGRYVIKDIEKNIDKCFSQIKTMDAIENSYLICLLVKIAIVLHGTRYIIGHCGML